MRQKVISLALVILMLVQISAQSLVVWADDGTDVKMAEEQTARAEESLEQKEEDTSTGESPAGELSAEEQLAGESLDKTGENTEADIAGEKRKADLLKRGVKDVSHLLTDKIIEVIQDGKILDPATDPIDISKPITISFKLKIPVVGDGGAEAVIEGDTAVIELGKGIKVETTTPIPMVGPKIEGFDKNAKVGEVQLITRSDGMTVASILFGGDKEVFDGTLSDVSVAFEGECSVIYVDDGSGTLITEIVVFGKKYNLTLKPLLVVDMDKTGVANLDERYIEWTIKTKAIEKINQQDNPFDIKDYVLRDDLTGAGPFVSGSMTLNGNPVPDPTLTTSGAEFGFEYKFPAGSKGEQTLVYRTALTDREAFTTVFLIKKNVAKLYDTNNVKKADAYREVQIIAEKWVGKNAERVKDAQGKVIEDEFEWYVDINYPQRKLKNVVVEDVLQSGMTFVRAVQRRNVNGTWEDIPGTEITAKPSDNRYVIGDIDEMRRLVIRVKIPKLVPPHTSEVYRNRAIITWDNNIRFYAGATFVFGVYSIQKGVEQTEVENPILNWNIHLKKQTIAGLSDPRIYDMVIFRRVVKEKGREIEIGFDQIKQFTDENGNDQINGVKIKDTQPIWIDFQKIVTDNSGNIKLNVISGDLKWKTYPLFYTDSDNNKIHVADLLEVTGTKNDMDWAFEFQTEVRNENEIFTERDNWINNTASLFDGGSLLSQRNGGRKYVSRMLEKQMLVNIAADEIKTDSDAAVINGEAVKDIDGNILRGKIAVDYQDGFNYKDNSVVFRISINGNDHKHLKEVTGEKNFYLKDILPERWEFVKLTDTADYYMYKANPVESGAKTATLEALGSPVSVPGLVVDDFIGKNEFLFTFTENLDGPYVLLVRAKPSKDMMERYFNATSIIRVENTAQLYGGYANQRIVRKQRLTLDRRILNKKHKDLTGALEWTIDYNPFEVKTKLPEVWLIDKLSDGMEFRTNADGSLNLNNNFAFYELTVNPDNSLVQGAAIPLKQGDNIVYDAAGRTIKVKIPEKDKAYRLWYITDVTGLAGQVVNNTVSVEASDLKIEQKADHYRITSASASAGYRLSAAIEVFKTDANNQPLKGAEFTLTLADGRKQVMVVTEDSGLVRFPNLPAGEHKLEETKAPDGYDRDTTVHTIKVDKSGTVNRVWINGQETKQLSVSNRKKPPVPQKITIKVVKEWKGPKATEAKVFLQINGTDVQPEQVVVLTEANGWSGEFKDLPKHDSVGAEIKYGVREEKITNYKTEISGSAANGFTVVNTYEPPVPPTPTPPDTPNPYDPPKPYEPPKDDEPQTPPVTPPTPPVPPTTDIPENPLPEGNTKTPPTTPSTPPIPPVPTVPLDDDDVPKGTLELPKTGGIPASIFYFVGGALIAGGKLRRRKRK